MIAVHLRCARRSKLECRGRSLYSKKNLHLDLELRTTPTVFFVTAEHLFYDCVYIQHLINFYKPWIYAILDGDIIINKKTMLYHNFKFINVYKHNIYLYFLQEFKYIIWNLRNDKIFNGAKPTLSTAIMIFSARLRLRLQTDFLRLGETDLKKILVNDGFSGDNKGGGILYRLLIKSFKHNIICKLVIMYISYIVYLLMLFFSNKI